jgi:pyruvate formate lyase activating enzyme
MILAESLSDLENCELCEHRCGINRLKGETGVCRVTMPIVASATLHPAPPESYTVFTAGCNFKCLNCQNWTISLYPDNQSVQRGYIDPETLAEECVRRLTSAPARQMGADRIFFSGGEPGIHLPFIETVVEAARQIKSETKINFDTNGYLTEKSLERVLAFATSVTFDLKAYHDELHLALTGASSEPVLRNAAHIGKHAKELIWEYRIVVIPDINEEDVRPLTEFISAIDSELPVCFLAFRPNFALEKHPGASRNLMEKCAHIGKQSGLKNVYWSGYSDLPGKVMGKEKKIKTLYGSESAWLAASYAFDAGCKTHPRGCRACDSNQTCMLKRYSPRAST